MLATVQRYTIDADAEVLSTRDARTHHQPMGDAQGERKLQLQRRQSARYKYRYMKWDIGLQLEDTKDAS